MMARIIITLLIFLALSDNADIPTSVESPSISVGNFLSRSIDTVGLSARLTAPQIIDRLGDASRLREARLRRYSVPSLYRVTTGDGEVLAEVNAVLHYRAPGTKEFTIVSENGSEAVRNRVLKPLMDVEVETAVGKNRLAGSIIPANYYFQLLGEETIDTHLCYLLQVTPKRVDKYLFLGKIWIHATEFSIVRISGQAARSPSFWISRIDFTRNYRKVGDFWLPARNESQTQVRFFGRNILTIDYGIYDMS